MSNRVKIAKILFASKDLFGEQSSRVFVDLWQAGQATPEGSSADLVADPEVLDLYDRWRDAYKQYYADLSLRAIRPRGAASHSRASDRQQLARLRQQLELNSEALVSGFNDWLGGQASFRDGIQNWLSARFNQEDDEIRIAIEIDDPNIRRLPWQAWKLLEQFDRAELSIGDTRRDSRRKPTIGQDRDRLKLLAVFGYEGGVNFDRDKATIEALPNIDVEFLLRPTVDDFREKLRRKRWDVLYFGGHSSSDAIGAKGVLYLDSDCPVPISQLKGALKTAVRAGGLQLGIFNSCDGLGLASELEDVHFPLSIVMREPVPNEVAQRFLTYFLQSYTNGQPLYLALLGRIEELAHCTQRLRSIGIAQAAVRASHPLQQCRHPRWRSLPVLQAVTIGRYRPCQPHRQPTDRPDSVNVARQLGISLHLLRSHKARRTNNCRARLTYPRCRHRHNSFDRSQVDRHDRVIRSPPHQIGGFNVSVDNVLFVQDLHCFQNLCQ